MAPRPIYRMISESTSTKKAGGTDDRNGWSRTFDDPITLRDGGELRTLRDAANYITKLPKREHDQPAWQAAMAALLLEAERGEAGADPMMARIGMLEALHAGRPALMPEPRQKRVKKYRVVR
jgi:hypothetical protein